MNATNTCRSVTNFLDRTLFHACIYLKFLIGLMTVIRHSELGKESYECSFILGRPTIY